MSPVRAMTLVSAAYNLGAMLGPISGGWIGERLGLRSVYLISAGIFSVSTVILFFLHSQPREAHDPAAPPESLWKNTRFISFLGIIFLAMFVMYLPQPLTPRFLQNERGLSLESIGLLGSIGNLGNTLLALALGTDRRPQRVPAGAGLGGSFLPVALEGHRAGLVCPGLLPAGWVPLDAFADLCPGPPADPSRPDGPGLWRGRDRQRAGGHAGAAAGGGAVYPGAWQGVLGERGFDRGDGGGVGNISPRRSGSRRTDGNHMPCRKVKMLEIVPLILGPVATNTYLIANSDTGEAAVIDPAWDGQYDCGRSQTAQLAHQPTLDHPRPLRPYRRQSGI